MSQIQLEKGSKHLSPEQLETLRPFLESLELGITSDGKLKATFDAAVSFFPLEDHTLILTFSFGKGRIL